jgi:predicted GH43/DUF377 family glycosyl hydrolase
LEGIYLKDLDVLFENFEKKKSPILKPVGNGFDSYAVFNPAVIKEDYTYYMFYRASDGSKDYTSWIGRAVSDDGINFKRDFEPAIVPEFNYEKRGCEDPRITKIGDTYFMTYVGIDGKNRSHICLATSRDLINWKKYGRILTKAGGEWDSRNRKAGVILPKKINGKYIMYYSGEKEPWHTAIGVAYSYDLFNWFDASETPIILPRKGYFDSMGVEPGAVSITDEGILLFYNGWDKKKVHKTGAVLFSKDDPTKIIGRTKKPILEPTEDWEKKGHVPNVTFAESVVRDEYSLKIYYGAADKSIGVLELKNKPIFKKSRENPILLPLNTYFENKDVFNPSLIVVDDIIYMLYRAEDRVWPIWKGTSRIGLAKSKDGVHFERKREPVIIPEHDYERPGGCEDPRVVKIEDTFYLTYTGWSLDAVNLCLARSKDLVHWDKLGPIFPWSTKSGAILPQKINGKYIMYFGDKDIWIAYSDDLIHWTAREEPVLRRRPGYFDSELVEPGPPPILTDEGILLIYNGNKKGLRKYSTGAVLFSKDDPTKVLKRTDVPFLEPEEPHEIYGQVSNVVFTEGLIKVGNTWHLYYGGADSNINVATFTGDLLTIFNHDKLNLLGQLEVR